MFPVHNQVTRRQRAAAARATDQLLLQKKNKAGNKHAAKLLFLLCELEVQQLRANAEAQAFALQGVERERALEKQLLRVQEELLRCCRLTIGSKTRRCRLAKGAAAHSKDKTPLKTPFEAIDAPTAPSELHERDNAQDTLRMRHAAPHLPALRPTLQPRSARDRRAQQHARRCSNKESTGGRSN
jgi:hypothetical protein